MCEPIVVERDFSFTTHYRLHCMVAVKDMRMDRQLKQQVEEFRRQQRRDSEVETEVQQLPDMTPEPGCLETTREESPEKPEEVQELQRLKDLALQMEQAFPEATDEGDASAAPSEPGYAAGRVGGLGYQELPVDRPLDEEVCHFKSVLDQLDLRLRALQSKQDLHIEDTDSTGKCPSADGGTVADAEPGASRRVGRRPAEGPTELGPEALWGFSLRLRDGRHGHWTD